LGKYGLRKGPNGGNCGPKPERKTEKVERIESIGQLHSPESADIYAGGVSIVPTRVARFFLVQHTKTGENIPNEKRPYVKYTKWSQKYQVAIKYTSVFH
jgi:hypothetical protein